MARAFKTDDLDVAQQILSDQYQRFQLHGLDGNRSMTMTMIQLGDHVTLHRFTFGMRFTASAGPLGVIPIAWVHAGTISHRYGRSDHDNGSGDVAVSIPPDRAWQCTADKLDIDGAYLTPALLTQVADGPPRAGAHPRFTAPGPISAAAAQVWKTTYDYVRIAAATLPTERAPLLTGSLARMLAATALAVFPNTAHSDPTIEDRHDAHPRTLRRAVSFIDDNAHRDITVAHIAAAAGVSIRTVQLAFRRHLNTTPTDYLRRVRLAHAREDLLAVSPGVDTVADIAVRWGFPDLSRFIAAYHAAYRVNPGQTLRH